MKLFKQEYFIIKLQFMQQSIKLLNTLMFLVLSMFLLSGCTEKTESNEQSLKKESTKALVSIEYIAKLHQT